MATRAELFRYFVERLGPKRPPAADRARPEEAAPTHNASPRAAKKATYALEASAGRPSRKSTRASANRQKNDVQFRMKRRAGESRPARPGRLGP